MPTLNLTPIFIVAGLGFLTILIEKTMSNSGGERHAFIVGIVSFILGFGVVIWLLMSTLNQIFNVFMGM
jgi:hypothetical protein